MTSKRFISSFIPLEETVFNPTQPHLQRLTVVSDISFAACVAFGAVCVHFKVDKTCHSKQMSLACNSKATALNAIRLEFTDLAQLFSEDALPTSPVLLLAANGCSPILENLTRAMGERQRRRSTAST